MKEKCAFVIALVAACGGGSKTPEKPDAPPATMTINGSAFFDLIDGSAGEQAFPFPAAVGIEITSASLVGSGFDIQTGVYSSTQGTFTVPVVQGDSTYAVGILFGSAGAGAIPIYVVGDGTSPDFSQTAWRTPDITVPMSVTNTTLNISGLNPWGTLDDLEIMDPSNGAVFFPFQLQTSPAKPAAGSNALTGAVVNWAAQANTQLLGSGDQINVWQLATAGSAGNQYAAIKNEVALTGPNQTDGSGGTITATLAAITQNETLQIQFNQTAFEGLEAATGGTKDDPEQFFLIDALPFASEHGDYGAAPDLVEWGINAKIPAGSAVAQTFTYANPFKLNATTALEEFTIVNWDFDVDVKAPGANGGTTITVGYHQDIPTAMLGSNAVIAPLVTPVTGVMVNGAAIAGASATGETPTISWTAPATGTITGYTVIVEKVANMTGGTTLTQTGSVNVNGTTTSVQLPPGLVTAGTNVGYVLIIIAYAEPGFDPSVSPLNQKMPDPQVTMVTGMFTP